MKLTARPEAITIDLTATAVLVIDMTNDFAAPGGMFDRAGIDIGVVRQAIEPIGRVLAAARAVGVPVVYVCQQHSADLSDAGPDEGPHAVKHRPLSIGVPITAPDGRPSRTMIENTWSTEVLPELAPHAQDPVVAKHRYSGFFETELDATLRRLGVRDLIVTGSTTSVCVDSTVRDAMFRGYRCVVLEDCTAEPIGADLPRTNHEATLLTIETLLGWVSHSRHVIGQLE